jgi:2-oxoglutarate ferredoxin oxidoreductase subunit gamma
MYFDLIIAGFGGQGVLLIGDLLSLTAIEEGYHVSFLPSYGVEMRGGTANCTVVISSEEIGSPVVSSPHAVIVMNLPSLIKFEPMIRPGGLLILNTSLIPEKEVKRSDIERVFIPLNTLAEGLGNTRLANMIALGALLEKTKIVNFNSVEASMKETLAQKYHHLIPANLEAIKKGAEFLQLKE